MGQAGVGPPVHILLRRALGGPPVAAACKLPTFRQTPPQYIIPPDATSFLKLDIFSAPPSQVPLPDTTCSVVKRAQHLLAMSTVQTTSILTGLQKGQHFVAAEELATIRDNDTTKFILGTTDAQQFEKVLMDFSGTQFSGKYLFGRRRGCGHSACDSGSTCPARSTRTPGRGSRHGFVSIAGCVFGSLDPSKVLTP